MTQEIKMSKWALSSLIFAVLGILKPLAICSLIAMILAGRYFYYNKKFGSILKGRVLAIIGMSLGLLVFVLRFFIAFGKA